MNYLYSKKVLFRKGMIICSTLLFLGLVFGLASSWFVAGKLIKPQPQLIGLSPEDLPAKVISLNSGSESTIRGWSIRADNSNGVVVLLHGIRSSRLAMLERARLFYAENFSVVMIDFQAHGESTGNHITVGYLEQHDVKAAVEFAHTEYPDETIGVLGISLGGASAVLAAPMNIEALILESVYPDIEAAVHNRVAKRLGLFGKLPAELLLAQLEPRLGISSSELKPIDRLAHIGSPVFLISGAEDQHTTAEETQEMFKVALEPKQLWLVDGAVHEDLYSASPETYKTKVLGFLNQHLRGQDKSAS